MRKILLFLLLVIILVSLDWFVKLRAQDLSTLTPAQRERLIRELGSGQTATPRPFSSENATYASPTIYDSVPSPHGPVSSVPTQTSNDATAPDASDQLQPFDQLRPFGTELFGGPAEAVPPSDITASRDYVLGPGDNVIIYLWGRAEQEYNLTIDREGSVFIPKVGTVPAWGKTVEEFESYARQRFSSVYSEFDLSVSLGRIRSIRIYLTGEVRRPGAYTVSSLTSLFNALYLAGGPTESGSMRAIRLMRGGKEVAAVDLYRFLLQGDNGGDVRLQSGDAIFVPVAGARVAIRGQVRREAVYELAGNETARELLTLAGGATAQAHLDRVMLERINDAGEWEVIDLTLNENPSDSAADMALIDGDRVTVYSIFEAKRNMVAVFGHVKHPGYYERRDSTTVADLIARGSLQPYDVYYDRANLFRRYSDWRIEVVPVNLRAVLDGDSSQNIILQDRDSLHVYAIDDVTWDKYVYIEGEVARPGRYPLYTDMSIQDLVFLAGSFTRSASTLQAELARFDSQGQVSLETVSLARSITTTRLLQEEDRLYIRRIPEWQLHRTVVLEGEIRFPGEYVLADRSETLYQILMRAGGFTQHAFPVGTVLERQSIGQSLERLRVPKLLERSNPIAVDSLGNLHAEVLFDYEPESVNRIIVDMNTIIDSDGRIGDVVLEPGDRIFVPSVPSGISVMGAVGANGTIKYAPQMKVKDYVERAGNFTPQSDKGNTRLIRASGEVYAGGGILGKTVNQGDVIVVPSKIERDSNWLKTLTTAITATTGVLTTVLLIERL
ncbi:MAG: SLBB domain-containing protein [candidate division Zixibacteria bacterium]|jgi:protein involved in polysaccharide export with SLBB domain|nr:SLBB domain-containing protein [candidate division Zixibacteria bacterium]